MADTHEERGAAAEAVRGRGGRPVLFEEFGGRDDDAEAAYLGEVERSDVYLGILRAAFGRVGQDGRSATQVEYEHASSRGLRICVWTAEGEAAAERDARLLAFIERVRSEHVTGAYRSAKQLAEQVRTRIDQLCAEDLSPWVKVGETIFRARLIRQRGREGKLEADLRAGPVLDAVQHLRRDRFGRGTSRQLTYRDQSIPITLGEVETTVVTGTRTRVALQFAIADPPTVMPYAFNSGGRTISAEDSVALRLRQRLFQEELPTDTYLWCDFAIDHAFLADPRVTDEIAPAIVKLLVTEALVGGGLVSAITTCNVAPISRDGRRCRIVWVDRRAYTNVPPQTRSVEGLIRR